MQIAQILKAIRIMWDLQTKLSQSDTLRGLEMAFTMIGEAIGTPVQENPVQFSPVTSKNEQALSFAEMQRLTRS
jgi:hypothetical protein